jgi:outer membrane protein assembly factor BamB
MRSTSFATLVLLLGVLTGCSSATPDDATDGAAGREAFCARAVALNEAPPQEPGGNNADELTALLAVSEPSIAEAVEIIRDYHRDVYVEGDPSTDTDDSLPDHVREAGDRLDAYSVEHCEGFEVPEVFDAGDWEAEEASLDPDRIECAPVGCEVWRRQLDGLPPIPQWVAGRPVVIEDEQLVGLELDTGEVRWEVPISDELRTREGGAVDLSLGRMMLTGNDELVAIANTQGVQLVSQTGQTQWSRPLPAERAHLSWVHVTGASVLVVHEFPPDPASTAEADSGEELQLDVAITVMDVRDGRVRWSHEGPQRAFSLPTLADQQELLLVDDGTGAIVAVELMSGELRYELPGGADVWPVHAGEILTLGDFAGAATETSRLFEAVDGTVRAELPGAARAVLDMDGRVVVLLERDGVGQEAASREAVAVDADGTVAWRQPVAPDDDGCCPSMLDLDGRLVRISDGPGAAALIVDSRDGSVHTDDPLATALENPVGLQGQHGRHLLLERPPPPDAPGFVLRDPAGRSLEIRGPASLGPTIGPQTEIILLATSRELVAVRFP